MDEFDILAELESTLKKKVQKPTITKPKTKFQRPAKSAIISKGPQLLRTRTLASKSPERKRRPYDPDDGTIECNKRKRGNTDRWENRSPSRSISPRRKPSKIECKYSHVKIVLVMQGIPGLGKSTLVPKLEKTLKEKHLKSVCVAQHDGVGEHIKKLGTRKTQEEFEDRLVEGYNVVILNRNNVTTHHYSQFLAMAREYDYKILACYPEEIENEWAINLLPVVLFAVYKRRGHPIFRGLTLDEQFHTTLMFFTKLKAADSTQVDKRFALSWLHPKKCGTMKSDMQTFLYDIVEHTKRSGWLGKEYDSSIIERRLKLRQYRYDNWRRTAESVATALWKNVSEFINTTYPGVLGPPPAGTKVNISQKQEPQHFPPPPRTSTAYKSPEHSPRNSPRRRRSRSRSRSRDRYDRYSRERERRRSPRKDRSRRFDRARD